MKWLRLWIEWAHDPKIIAMPESMQRRHIVLLCLRRQVDTSTLSDEEIASYMRIGMEDLQETKELFTRKNFIDNGWNVLAWDDRQYDSDSSTLRTRKWRKRQRKKERDKKETSQERHGDGVDTDTETDKDYTSSKEEEVLSEPPAQTPPCPHGKIKELYNKYCKSLPGLLTMSKQRKVKLKTRWGEHPNLDWWQALFETVEQIPFCCGDNDRGWKASFDWLVANDTNALKVMEGKYFKQEVLKKSDGLVGCKKCTLRSGASTMDLDEHGVCWSCREKRRF